MSRLEDTTSFWRWFPEKILVPLLVAIISVTGTYWFATREKSPPESNDLAVEGIPQDIFVFAGNNKPDGGTGMFYVIYDEQQLPTYRMDYSLPGDKYGYAGLVFQFPNGYDLSAYKVLKFTIEFKNPKDEIDLFIKDVNNNENKLHIVGNGNIEMNLSYDFTNFSNVNLKVVKEIGVIASTDFSLGDHQVLIKDVHFVK